MRNLSKILFMTSLLMSGNIARADIRDVFDTYASTSVSTFNGQQMQGITGAAISLRNTNMYDRNLYSIQLPSISAGCGGIDAFAGAFSMITKDELVQVARGIAAGAPGYFFNLAIDSVCPTCGANMKELSRKLNSFNELTRDACNTAWDKVVEKADISKPEWLSNAVDSFGTEMKAAIGDVPDFSSVFSDKKAPPADGNVNADISPTIMKELFEGNIVFQLFQSQPTTYTDLNGIELNPHEFFMTFFGSALTTVETTAGGDPLVKLNVEPPSTSIKDLLYGPEDGTIDYRKCNLSIPLCQDLIMDPVAYEGLIPKYQKIVSNQSPDPAELGIIQRIYHRLDVTDEQKQFMQTYNYPYVSWANKCYYGAADTVSYIVAASVAMEKVAELTSQVAVEARYNIKNSYVSDKWLFSSNNLEELIVEAKQKVGEERVIIDEQIKKQNDALLLQIGMKECE